VSAWKRFLHRLFGRPLDQESVRRPVARAVSSQKTQPKPSSAKLQTRSRNESATRSVQLGIDFGTCWSKIVIRDYEANTDRAFVVRVSRNKKGETDFRIPSAVTFLNGSLYFGWSGVEKGSNRAGIVYRSIKMRAAFSTSIEYSDLPPMPAGLTEEDLATLVVAYLIQIASAAAVDYTTALPDGPKLPRPGMSIGVPMSLGQDSKRRSLFVQIARVAFEMCQHQLPSLADGLDSKAALRMLEEARLRLEKKGPPREPRDWVRSEAEAGLHWILRSPRVPRRLYMCADVGAGTTDVSVFRIVEQFEDGTWYKGRLAFYSAVSGLPGVDGIDARIASQAGCSIDKVRGHENELIRDGKLDADAELVQVIGRMYGIHREAWRQGYAKDKGEENWKRFGLFVLGGGSKIDAVVNAIGKSTWPGRLDDRRPISCDQPTDLFEMPVRSKARNWFGAAEELKRFTGDSAFLLVAYGLSYMGGDVPSSDTPDQVDAYSPPRMPRRSIDQDEYYPK
jgi:hypothetical protein